MCLDAASDKAVEDHGRAARSFIGEQTGPFVHQFNASLNCVLVPEILDSRYNGFLRPIRLSSSDRAPHGVPWSGDGGC